MKPFKLVIQRPSLKMPQQFISSVNVQNMRKMEIKNRERALHVITPTTLQHVDTRASFARPNSNSVIFEFVKFRSNLTRPKGVISIKIPSCSLLGGS